ncbi:MAG: nucleotidyltransferase family protein [Clostridia bacterium]
MIDYRKFCIEKSKNLRTAMKQLDETSKKILFVTEDERLVASLTDGDLRRYLLSGGAMNDLAFSAANKSPYTTRDRKEAMNFLRNAEYMAVPITTLDGRITDILFADERQDASYPQIGLPVVIMAGGKGTRLEPYTKILPKPLIPIGDLPIIEHIMQQFSRYGCNEFHVIVNHKKELIKAYFSENDCHYNIHWYNEDKPLGTGGGLYMLKEKMNGSFFLTNCDVLIQADYSDLFGFHRTNCNIVTMVCAYKNIVIPYGVVDTGDQGEIVAMKEKPEISFQTNTGMYLVESKALDSIENSVACSFPDIIEKLKRDGQRVAAYPISENDWLDMGQMTELEKMRKRLYGE